MAPWIIIDMTIKKGRLFQVFAWLEQNAFLYMREKNGGLNFSSELFVLQYIEIGPYASPNR